MKETHRLDIESRSFEVSPDLNVARKSHSVVVLGTSLYVVCGYNEEFLSSIEKLDVTIKNSAWSLLAIPDLIGREQAFVTRVSDQEIVVAGGKNVDGRLNDVSIVNTAKCFARRAKGMIDNPYVKPFICVSQAHGLEPFALIEQNKGLPLSAVEFDRTNQKLDCFHSFRHC